MRRKDLQALAIAKAQDAQILYKHGRFASAYYLSGYALEFALKACIAKQISEDTIPDKAILKDVLTHDFPKLIGLAGLKAELKAEQVRDANFGANWAICSEWTPDSRYRSTIAPTEANYIISALIDNSSGVLKWIKTYW